MAGIKQISASLVGGCRLLRHRIMKQCSQWLQQAAGLDPLFQKRLKDAVLELHAELAKL